MIKPQEVNQARLFSVDTRIKEGELCRLKDLQFMRDTFKKLIYAIEQNSMAKQASGAMTETVRPTSYGGVSKRAHRSGYGQSVADANFGITAQSLLPKLNNDGNMSLNNPKLSEQFLASGSFLDVKSSQAQGLSGIIGVGAGNPTSEILFLKRLLFLKAALDNDQCISNFAVPFEED